MTSFPPTQRSVIVAVQSGRPEERRAAFDALVASYWKPVYKYIRVRGQASSEDARDLTQEFFARALEKGFFAPYDPTRARFRTFLRVCLDGFLSNERKAASRIKRGGHVDVLSLDFAGAEGELGPHAVASDPDPEEFFYREWVRELFGQVVAELCAECQASGRQMHFKLFERYDLDGPASIQKVSYADVAHEFGLTTVQVTNYLAAIRKEFRRLVLEKLQERCASDEEYRAEARQLLGLTL